MASSRPALVTQMQLCSASSRPALVTQLQLCSASSRPALVTQLQLCSASSRPALVTQLQFSSVSSWQVPVTQLQLCSTSSQSSLQLDSVSSRADVIYQEQLRFQYALVSQLSTGSIRVAAGRYNPHSWLLSKCPCHKAFSDTEKNTVYLLFLNNVCCFVLIYILSKYR